MKQKCDDLKLRLVDYLDGHLEPAEERALEAHLGDCESCRSMLFEHRQAWALLDAYAAREASPGFVASTLRELHGQRAAGRVQAWRRAFAAAAAALLLACAFLLSTSSTPPTGTPGTAESNLVDAGLLENLDLIEDLDFLEEYGEDLELAMEYDLYQVMIDEENRR